MAQCMHGKLSCFLYILLFRVPFTGSVCPVWESGCEGLRYCVSTEEVTLMEAKNRCQDAAGFRSVGNLVIVDNEERWNFVKKIAGGVKHWIGLSTFKDLTDPSLTLDQRREGWTWIDSSWYNPLWNKWSEDKTNGPYPMRLFQCAIQDENGNWLNNLGCIHDKTRYVCQATGGSSTSCSLAMGLTSTLSTSTTPTSTPIPTTPAKVSSAATTPSSQTTTVSDVNKHTVTNGVNGGSQDTRNISVSNNEGTTQNDVGKTVLYTVLGAIVGGLVLIAIILAFIVCFNRKTKRAAQNEEREKMDFGNLDQEVGKNNGLSSQKQTDNATPFFFTGDDGTNAKSSTRESQHALEQQDNPVPDDFAEDPHYDRIGPEANPDIIPTKEVDTPMAYPVKVVVVDPKSQTKTNSQYSIQYPEDADCPYAVVSQEWRDSKKNKKRQSALSVSGDMEFAENEMYNY